MFAEQSVESPFPAEPENSLMVVTTREEFCFLWDRDCLPELLESLLECGEVPAEANSFHPLSVPETSNDRPLTIDHFRTVARELLIRCHQAI